MGDAGGAVFAMEVADGQRRRLADPDARAPEDLQHHRRPAQRLSLGDLDYAGHLALADDARDEFAPGSHLPRGRYVCPDPDAVEVEAELAQHDETALARHVGFPLAPGGNGLGPLHVDDLGDEGHRVQEIGHVPQPSLRAFRHYEAQVLAEGDVAPTGAARPPVNSILIGMTAPPGQAGAAAPRRLTGSAW